MKICRIAILTSGGDAPGMNKAIESLVSRALDFNIQPYVVINGYRGLCEGDIRIANLKLIDTNASLAGSVILCSRFTDFKKASNVKKAVDNLKKNQIDALIVLGGNGSYLGAKLLIENGVKVICLPCTIDNDIKFTEYSIGFHSALNTISETLDLLKSTAKTHGNIFLVELMGRKCSALTIATALANKVDYVITPKNILNKEQILNIVKKIMLNNHYDIFILITENLYQNDELKEIAKFLQENTNKSSKIHIMGFIQRGAKPTGIERYNATRMAFYAIECLINGVFNIAIGIDGKKVMTKDLLNNDFHLDDNDNELNRMLTIINKY